MRGHLEEDADAARSFHSGRPGGAAFGAAGQRSGDPGFSFHEIATWTSNALGTPVAFASACGLVVLWLVAGPIFNYSDSWQLVINTGTTIATFLMVFLVQNTQNRHARALHLKLDELLRSIKSARNALINLEECTDEEMEVLKQQFEKLRVAKLSSRDC